ncbi:Hypothetical predicted protein, partial [Olea europaea subsp. europaea]
RKLAAARRATHSGQAGTRVVPDARARALVCGKVARTTLVVHSLARSPVSTRKSRTTTSGEIKRPVIEFRLTGSHATDTRRVTCGARSPAREVRPLVCVPHARTPQRVDRKMFAENAQECAVGCAQDSTDMRSRFECPLRVFCPVKFLVPSRVGISQAARVPRGCLAPSSSALLLLLLLLSVKLIGFVNFRARASRGDKIFIRARREGAKCVRLSARRPRAEIMESIEIH